MSGSLLAIIAQEWDNAAQRLVTENRAIRALFRQAETTGPGRRPGEGSARVGRRDDEDLRISALDVANSGLRAALIRLHAIVEARSDPAAQTLNAAIWAELSASTERRKIAGSPF